MTKNTGLSTPAQLQCSRSGAWEPGNEARKFVRTGLTLRSVASTIRELTYTGFEWLLTSDTIMDHEALAFRRLVADFSQKLSKEERRRLVYIRLYDWRERYRDADTLDVLSRLESDGAFSPENPEGLIEVAKDIDRQDLRAMVKDFVKNWKKQKKDKATSKVTARAAMSFESKSPLSDEELQLKAILEVTLSQTAVLVKQVDILQQAITTGTDLRQRAAEAIRNARYTAQTLAEHFQRAQGELEHSGSNTNLRNNISNLKSSKPCRYG